MNFSDEDVNDFGHADLIIGVRGVYESASRGHLEVTDRRLLRLKGEGGAHTHTDTHTHPNTHTHTHTHTVSRGEVCGPVLPTRTRDLDKEPHM